MSKRPVTNKSVLYQSLDLAIRHPSCVTLSWLQKIESLKIFPRELTNPLYHRNSLTFVDEDERLFALLFLPFLILRGHTLMSILITLFYKVFNGGNEAMSHA